MRQTILIISLLALSFGCSITEKAPRGLKYSIQAGLNKGGVTENTDLSIIPNKQYSDVTVDAYTGATRTGANAGIHVNAPLRFGEIESGIDYMYNHHIFSYYDQGNLYWGERKIDVNQIMVPLTYNFQLFTKLLPKSEIQLKLGYQGQLNLISTSETGILPGYSINKWSNGATAGLSFYPMRFKTGSKIGFYLDAYRGSRIYTDYYNQEGFEVPGSSFVKFGVRYQFNNNGK